MSRRPSETEMEKKGALLATWNVRAEAERVWVSRRTLELAMWSGASRQAGLEVATAVAELASNAVRYAGGGVVELWLEELPGPTLVLIVSDKGQGFVPQDSVSLDSVPRVGGDAPASNGAEFRSYHSEKHGLGIGLDTVRRMMTSVFIESGLDGTTVRASKTLKR